MLLVQKANQGFESLLGGGIRHVIHAFGTCFKWITNVRYGVDNLS